VIASAVPLTKDTEFIDVNKRETKIKLDVGRFLLLPSPLFALALGPRPSPSASNLSGFASLREISTIRRRNFFTPRREGAKKAHDRSGLTFEAFLRGQELG
jgi:hypothetical protein